MSKNLHYTTINFFEDRMTGHSKVSTFDDISTDEFYIYRVHRKDGLSPVVVWLSDAYSFTQAEFLARPKKPKINYILTAGFMASHLGPISENWNGIGVGNIKGFMGALNKEQVWKYSPPRKKEQ